MSTIIIGGIIGGVILFVWQFMSWTFLEVHAKEFTYTSKQQEILECLAENLETGEFMVPGVPSGTSSEERRRLGQEMNGKPWAIVKYRSSFNPNMPLNMIRGLSVNVLSVLLLCWIFGKIPNPEFLEILLSSMAVGIVAYLNISYIESVWFKTSSIGYLIDAVVSWALVGAFLGWWMC